MLIRLLNIFGYTEKEHDLIELNTVDVGVTSDVQAGTLKISTNFGEDFTEKVRKNNRKIS